jgi:hypothetical protein
MKTLPLSQSEERASGAQSIDLVWRLTCTKEQDVGHQFLSSKEFRIHNRPYLLELL